MVLSIQRPPKSNEQVVGEPDAPDNLAAAEAEAAFELHPASLRPSTSLLPSTRKPAPLSFYGELSCFTADEASRACIFAAPQDEAAP